MLMQPPLLADQQVQGMVSFCGKRLPNYMKEIPDKVRIRWGVACLDRLTALENVVIFRIPHFQP